MPARRVLTYRPSLLAVCLLVHILRATASLVNVTIDDADSLITYAPSPHWWDRQGCSGCQTKPDPKQAFDGTWHNTTFPQGGSEADLRSVSFNFTGSAIYVYGVLGHTAQSPDCNIDLLFFIDEEIVGEFRSSPSGDTTFDFNAPLYLNSSVPFGPHSFTLQVGRVGGASSLVFLDYIMYTTQDDVVSEISSVVTSHSALPPTQANAVLPPSLVSSTSSFTTSILVSQTVPPVSPAALPDAASTPSNATTSYTSQSPTPGPADFEDQHHASSTNTKTIIIATTVAGGVLLLAIIATLAYFCTRQTRRAAFSYNPPPERDITDNPMTSGWTGDTWGDDATMDNSPEHPSLVSTKDLPEGVRGDPAARESERPRREVSSKKRQHGLAETATPMAAGVNRNPSQRPSTSSTAVDHSRPVVIRAHRHPYAARTPEPDIDPDVEEMGIQEETNGPGLDEPVSFMPDFEDDPTKDPPPREPVPAPASVPRQTTTAQVTPTPQNVPVLGHSAVPELPSTGTRPLPMRPVWESQANAARVRRQNSANVIAGISEHQESPPPYEAANRSRNQI